MGNPLLTAVLLVAAGALFFRRRDWTNRWIGFFLVSAGLNHAAPVSRDFEGYALITWVLMISVFCIVAIFESPNKG